MQPESTIKRCKHSVYDPKGNARYCSICTPVTITGAILKRIKTSVGPLTLCIETGQTIPPAKVKEWEDRLEALGLGLTKGADAEDSIAITEYFEQQDHEKANNNEVANGFQLLSMLVPDRFDRHRASLTLAVGVTEQEELDQSLGGVEHGED
jgi:hypothetical protein